LLPIDGPSAGAAIDWKLGDFTVRALYAAADAANHGNQSQPIRGTSSFTRVLYPNTLSNLETSGDRGLFGSTYQGSLEVEYASLKNLAIRLQYSGGEVFSNRYDVFGINGEVTISPEIAIFGRYGVGKYNNTEFGDLNLSYWMAGIALPDLFLKGAMAGFAAGQPFIAKEVGNATQTNFEAFYRLPISKNIQFTPLIQVVTNAGNRNENGAIVTGTLRVVFLF